MRGKTSIFLKVTFLCSLFSSVRYDRVLDSLHNWRTLRGTDNRRTRKRWRRFIKHNPWVFIGQIAGTVFVLGLVPLTFWLSQQIYECPRWAYDCKVTINNIGTVQGVVTAIYTAGLASMAYTIYALAEASVWPLLCKQSFTLKQLDTFLCISRGSIPSAFLAFTVIKTLDAALIIICTILVSLMPLLAPLLVGYVYDQPEISVIYRSQYPPSGGIGQIFIQTNPPIASRVNAISLFTSWAMKDTQEPMPEYRDWYIDRQSLSVKGSFVAQAVRIKRDTACRGWGVEQVTTPDAKGARRVSFKTHMADPIHNHRKKNSSGDVLVRNYPQLATWVDDFIFQSPTRTSATVVFAALGGRIEGGLQNKLHGLPGRVMPNVSALACNVDVELVDETLTVGSGLSPANAPHPLPTLSSLAKLFVGGKNNTKDYTYNEVALWLAVAPVVVGTSVDGTQPLWISTNGQLPLAYTTTNTNDNTWTINELKNFIHVSMGAVAQSSSHPPNTSTRKPRELEMLTSAIPAKGLDPSRIWLLALPVMMMLLLATILGWWVPRLHSRVNLSIMRLAGPAELLKSFQTPSLQQRAQADASMGHDMSRLERVEVTYGVTELGGIGLGCPEDMHTLV